MVNVVQLFMTIITVQLFFSLGITLFTNALPADTVQFVAGFSSPTRTVNLTTTGGEIQGSLERQTNLALIDVGALVFFSGNIFLDLLLNFAFAIPEMVGLLISGFLFLFNIDSGIMLLIEGFTAILLYSLYFIALIQFIASIRSGRVIQ